MLDRYWSGFCVLVVTGCVDGPLPPVEGEHHQYVVSGLRVPTSNVEAQETGLDLDADGARDNQLGQVFGTLASRGLGVSGTADEALVRGNAIMVVDLQTTSFSDAVHPGLVTYLGANPEPAACTDPTQIATCGRHLQTRATYDVLPDSASDVGRGRFDDGRFLARTGTMPIEIALDAEAPLRVTLYGARVLLRNMSPAGGTGILAGGITAADLTSVVIPEAARQMARIVATECGQPPPTPGFCGCLPDSRGLELEQLFDLDRDCVIADDELRDNSLVQSLTSSDVRIDGRNLLSIGIGVDLVPASFTAPDS